MVYRYPVFHGYLWHFLAQVMFVIKGILYSSVDFISYVFKAALGHNLSRLI